LFLVKGVLLLLIGELTFGTVDTIFGQSVHPSRETHQVGVLPTFR
jgi:hypothetical protein